jgi:hypothetical protein
MYRRDRFEKHMASIGYAIGFWGLVAIVAGVFASLIRYWLVLIHSPLIERAGSEIPPALVLIERFGANTGVTMLWFGFAVYALSRLIEKR